jgi:tetratricopeptide (TPR) repeat protein
VGEAESKATMEISINTTRLDFRERCLIGLTNNFHLARAKLFLAAAQLLIRPPYIVSLSFSAQGRNYFVDEITEGLELVRLWRGVGLGDLNRWGVIFKQLVKLVLEGSIPPGTNVDLNAIYTAQFHNKDDASIQQAIFRSYCPFNKRLIRPEEAATYKFVAYELSELQKAAARLFYLLAGSRYVETETWREAANVYERGAEASEPEQAKELYRLAATYFIRAECYREAASCLEKAAKLAQGREALLLFLDAAEQHKRDDNFGRVRFCFQRALEQAKPEEEEALFLIIANYYLKVNRVDLAVQTYENAARRFLKRGERRIAASFWQRSGREEHKTGRYRDAAYAYEEAAKLLVNEEAYACWIKAAENYNLGGNPRSAAFCYRSAAVASAAIGDSAKERVALLKAIELYTSVGEPQWTVDLRKRLAKISDR